MGDSNIKKLGLQAREGLSLTKNLTKRISGDFSKEKFLREVSDNRIDFLNNQIGFKLRSKGLTLQEAENEIIKNTIEAFNLGEQ